MRKSLKNVSSSFMGIINDPEEDAMKDQLATFFYFTSDRDTFNVTDLMNLIAFGGPINEKLDEYVKAHVKKISENQRQKQSPKTPTNKIKMKDIIPLNQDSDSFLSISESDNNA